MENYTERLHWDNIKDYRGSVLLIQENNVGSVKVLEDVEREELLKVDTYVEHNNSEYGANSFVILHKIEHRLIDDRNNLILLSKPERIEFRR